MSVLSEIALQFSHSASHWVPLAVIGAGLTGSLHCTAMCAPLILGATLHGTPLSSPPRRPFVGALVAYQLGRLLGYVLLGSLAGALGSSLLSHLGGTLGRALGWVSTALVTAAFLALAWKTWKGESPHLLPADLAYKPMQKVLSSKNLSPISRAGLIGSMTALLPCGWLHSFVLAAATTRSAAAGGALLALFWASTLPALSLGPILIRKILSPLSQVAPRASAILLLLAALGSIGLQWVPLAARAQAASSSHAHEVLPADATGAIPSKPHCHEGH